MVGIWLFVYVIGLIVGYYLSFSCVQASDRPWALFFVSSQWFWFTVMFQSGERVPLCGHNIYWRFGAASELRASFWASKTSLILTPPQPSKWFSYWSFQGGSSVAALCLCDCVFIYDVCVILFCYSSLRPLVARKGCASWLWLFGGYFHFYFFFIDTSGRLCFLFVAFPG